MKNIFVYNSVLTVVIWSISVFASSPYPVVIQLTMKKNEVKYAKDLDITLKITSRHKHPIELPEEGNWGYAFYKTGVFAIQLQKKEGDKYVDLTQGAGHMDNVPLFKKDTIYRNQNRIYPFSINLLYRYSKGEYRIRVLCRFSLFNDLEDQYSNWVYFNCKSEINPLF